MFSRSIGVPAMDITQVKIFPVQEDKLKAFVSVVFDQCFMVNDIKVIQGKDGLFLSMPSRRKKSGEFKDVAHPLNNEMRRRLEESVLAEYRAMVDDPTPRRPDREGEELGFEGDVAQPPLAAVAAAPPAAQAGGTGMAPASLGAVSEASPNGSGPVSAEEDPSQKTLEEVQEIHLRDSFWSVS
ncbi:MAG: septation regulator SpoVG [Acidobacteriota bacterium]